MPVWSWLARDHQQGDAAGEEERELSVLLDAPDECEHEGLDGQVLQRGGAADAAEHARGRQQRSLVQRLTHALQEQVVARELLSEIQEYP